MNEPFRILALDGGGMRGIFTAGCLSELDRAIGSSFVDCFDLIVGTSTGGIIALGLAAGHSPHEMLDFYVQHGPKIFGSPRPIAIQLFRPKYSRQPLDQILQHTFGDLRMNDLKKAVCITAHEMIEGTTRVWKDDHASRLWAGGEQLVWKVAAATSAAPRIFPPVQLGSQDSHIDGGVWANNPAIVGITEAIHYFDRPLEQLRLLSVGTTSRVLRMASHRNAERLGIYGWMKESLSLLQGSVSMASHRQAALLLGQEHYVRLDIEANNRVRLDDVQGCLPLVERGEQAAREGAERVRRLLDL